MSVGLEYDLSGLFQPLDVRNIRLASRFVMPAMGRHWNVDGRPQERLARYYRRRVEGGTALIISEACAIDHPSATQGIHDGHATEQTRDAWARCADAVRGAGGHFFLQLWHHGGLRPEHGDGPNAGYPTLSPSGYGTPTHRNGRAATVAELDEIKDAFVRGAIIAKEAGASGVEVHGAHGFLLDQFLWHGTNFRNDLYGGSDIRDRRAFPLRSWLRFVTRWGRTSSSAFGSHSGKRKTTKRKSPTLQPSLRRCSPVSAMPA